MNEPVHFSHGEEPSGKRVQPADNDVKIAINTLIWMLGPDTMTLKEADELAVYVFERLRPGDRE